MKKLKVTKGLAANVPTLDIAQLVWTTDTKKFIIGTATGNFELDGAGIDGSTVLNGIIAPTTEGVA